MMRCTMCDCEMVDAEPFCPECVEMLNDVMDLQLEGVSSDTEED